ncbi:hypothetical protein ABER99_21240 [Paenibacillus glucanolyticus]|uniref:Uncharacterized protein n=1 Tax=Paenibacillus glucanolyticus TaxID=59843 RepID=A0A163G7Z8_9BACL|nr:MULTISPECIES: hypothetical protein [Paenibacillus]KZS44783.1 hypothetical protein AWU65_01975 [Paenibacillus glucanolyticus]MDH6675692.1 hypothetical protein [Paenibacillus sp. LBL]OMF64448.1 hypothetical protein BK142_31865 [Paenibacillus glucanolyticus]
MKIIDYIYGIDVSSRSKNLGWVKINAMGEIVDGGIGLNRLPYILDQDIKNKSLSIAIGIEAVMWYPFPDITDGVYEMKGRFPEELGMYRCHQGVAAATTVKTMLLERSIFLDKDTLKTDATKNVKKMLIGDSRIFLYEGFGAGEYKPKGNYNLFMNNASLSVPNGPLLKGEDSIDAFVIASAALYGLTSYINPNFPNQYTKHLVVTYDNQYKTIFQGLHETIYHAGYHCIWESIVGHSFKEDEPKVCNIYGFKWK